MLRVSRSRDALSEAGLPAAGGWSARGPVFYGWVLVATLAVTETVSYGVLAYAFPVFLAPMEGEMGWSRTAMTGAYSLASLVAGLAAIPVGRWVDRHGPRALMTAGSCAAAALLLAWSRVESLTALYLVWAGLGVAQAAVLYEPAFAAVAAWFVRQRGRALTLLTFVGGFASVVFVPLAAGLVEQMGWREALVWLAVMVALLTAVPHALVLRRRPEDLGLHPDGAPAASRVRVGSAPASSSAPGVAARVAVRTASFRWLAVAFGASALVTTGVAVHLIPLLLERGRTPEVAAAALAAVGVVALPGRLVFTPLGSRWPRPLVTASIFVLQALGLGVLWAWPSGPGLWAFAALFGAGFGAISPARAALVAELFGSTHFGSISGTLALVLAGARAAAPVGASLLHGAMGGYAPVLALLIGLCAASAVAVLLAERADLSTRRDG